MRLYLACDVTLLADVFEHFRTISLHYYQLDPAYYLSTPQLAWDALLKFELPRQIYLQHDPEIYRMVQPAIRGGICHAAFRHARANNKYMGARYDPQTPSSYIFYIDANNLYGWAQSQPLPHGEMKWVPERKLRALELQLQTAAPPRTEHVDTKDYYIFDVDLEYPQGSS